MPCLCESLASTRVLSQLLLRCPTTVKRPSERARFPKLPTAFTRSLLGAVQNANVRHAETPMSTPAHKFFDTHVVPSVDEFQRNPLDIRLAMNAAVALNQLADHFWHHYRVSNPGRVFQAATPGVFRDQLSARYPDFTVVRDVAEAHKHVELSRGSRVITRADQTGEGSTAYGEGGFGTGPWNGGPSLIANRNNGERVHLSHAVETVFEMWKSLLP